MHALNIVHRDIKLENILLAPEETMQDDEINVKLIDFGFAAICDTENGMDQVVGTIPYLAPEMIKGEKYGKPVDIWAIGVLTYLMLTGQKPFPGNNLEEIYDNM